MPKVTFEMFLNSYKGKWKLGDKDNTCIAISNGNSPFAVKNQLKNRYYSGRKLVVRGVYTHSRKIINATSLLLV
jgi:hypothetical protein